MFSVGYPWALDCTPTGKGPRDGFENGSDGSEGVEFMALRIVWRNPVSLIRNKPTLNRVRRDQFGTVYVVTYPHLSQPFELTLREVA